IRLMAASAQTKPHHVQASSAEFAADIEMLIERQGEPFGSTSIYAQYKVAEAARDAGIKVLLDGQGSDELFAGYRFYLGARVAGLLASGEPVRAARLLSRVSRLPGVRLPAALYHTLASLDVPGLGLIVRSAEYRAGPAGLIDGRWRATHAPGQQPRRKPRHLA